MLTAKAEITKESPETGVVEGVVVVPESEPGKEGESVFFDFSCIPDFWDRKVIISPL